MSQKGQSLAKVPSSGTPARSLHGCWTCRVRKKKCDETRPQCSVCMSLELECHGYGDRPIWMDSGPLQKAQALKVKNAVSRNNFHRKKRRSECPDSERSAEMDIAQEGMSSNSEGHSNYSTDRAHPYGTGWDIEVQANGPSDEPQFWNMDLDMNFFDKNICMGVSEENLLATESYFNIPRWANEKEADDELASHCGQKVLPLPVYRHYDGAGSKSTITVVSPNHQSAGEQPYFVPEDGMHTGENNAARIGWPRSSRTTPGPLVNHTHAVKEASVFDVSSREPLLRQDKEDMLLLYYLDEVFYAQYPLYNAPNKRFRNWLFSIIRRVPSVYHATLALSECHLESTIENYTTTKKKGDKDYYSLALQEVELKVKECSSLSGGAQLVNSLENLACVLQILSYEHFSGGNGNWRPHLLLAADLIISLTQARIQSTTSHSSDLQNEHRRAPEICKYFEDDIGIQVVLGSIISYDIIAAASTRSPPSLGLYHETILKRFGITLQTLFGYTNRVMTLIVEIVFLDHWKKEQEKNCKLSMVELVRRGTKIEEQLERHIADLRSNSAPKSSSILSASQIEITYIYALSALTYLHVVVSGAHSEMPEIKESVSRTLSAFQSLADPKLLRTLVWPFCVSGCLALEGQQKAFCELVSKAEITSLTMGTCLQAFEIIKECWEMRRTYKYNCDWVLVMNKLGYCFPLI